MSHSTRATSWMHSLIPLSLVWMDALAWPSHSTTRQSSKSAPSSKPPLTSSRSSVHSKTETLAVTSQPSAWSRRAAVTADREPDPPVLEDLGEVATEESNGETQGFKHLSP